MNNLSLKILVADDHTIVRKGIVKILSEAYINPFIEEAADGNITLAKASQNKWDIIIADYSMPGCWGIDLIKRLLEITPQTPVLVLSSHATDPYALYVIKAGAFGYLSKSNAPEELVNAINSICKGKKFLTPEVFEVLQQSLTHTPTTTKQLTLKAREIEVLKYLSQGNNLPEIAEKLQATTNTATYYRNRLLIKLQLQNNAELISYFFLNFPQAHKS